MIILYESLFHDILNKIKDNKIAYKIKNNYSVKNEDYASVVVHILSNSMLKLKYNPTDEYALHRRQYGAKSFFKTEEVKLGSFLTKFIGIENNSDIEEFIYLFRGAYDDFMRTDDFVIVKGEDIVRWYSKKKSKIKSCMTNKSYRLRFYAMNPDKVRLLILKDEKNMCIGRCLLWKLDYPKGIIYADRVYTNSQSDRTRFQRYIQGKAKEKGWLSIDDDYNTPKLVVLSPFIGTLPYFDTFGVSSRFPTILKTGKPPLSYIKSVVNSFSIGNNKNFENLNNFQNFIR